VAFLQNASSKLAGLYHVFRSDPLTAAPLQTLNKGKTTADGDATATIGAF